jgi:hypothetical protein
MAHVRFLKNANGSLGAFRRNDERELEDGIAVSWSDAGVVEILSDDPEPAVEEIETAVDPAPVAAEAAVAPAQRVAHQKKRR